MTTDKPSAGELATELEKWCSRQSFTQHDERLFMDILSALRPPVAGAEVGVTRAEREFKPGDKVSTGHTLKKRLTKSPHPSCIINDTDLRAWEYEGGGWDYEKTFALTPVAERGGGE